MVDRHRIAIRGSRLVQINLDEDHQLAIQSNTPVLVTQTQVNMTLDVTGHLLEMTDTPQLPLAFLLDLPLRMPAHITQTRLVLDQTPTRGA